MGRGRNDSAMTKRRRSMTRKTRRKYDKTREEAGLLPKINDVSRIRPKGKTHLRDNSTIKRLKMYRDRPVRDKKGWILQQKYMRYDTDEPVSRIAPDRRWFGNTKVISQKQLTLFREQMASTVKDPFSIVLKAKKIPYGLLDVDAKKTNRMKLLQIESFDSTFGPKMQRKKPKLKANTLESFAQRAQKKAS